MHRDDDALSQFLNGLRLSSACLVHVCPVDALRNRARWHSRGTGAVLQAGGPCESSLTPPNALFLDRHRSNSAGAESQMCMRSS